MAQTGVAQLADVIPVLPARDVAEAVHFHVTRLGVEVVFHEGDYASVRKDTQLRDTEWGTREFAFWDLNHNGLTFMRDL